jgi:hypothetical protein
MSALPPKADITGCDRHVRFVPRADILLKLERVRRPRRQGESAPALSAAKACSKANQSQRLPIAGYCFGGRGDCGDATWTGLDESWVETCAEC